MRLCNFHLSYSCPCVALDNIKPDDEAAPACAAPAWRAGPRVRVDSLSKGTRFRAIDGRVWTYVRRDGALSGAHHVTGDDGTTTQFAGCAEVVRL